MNDYATLFFNHLMMENEIRGVWGEIKLIREDPTLPDCVKFSIIQKLFEVHNLLDVESTREQENYMSSFLEALNLAEIGAKPMTEGRLKVHINQQMRKPNRNPRALSFGFYDPGVVVDKRQPSQISSNSSSSGILLDRKVEIEKQLRHFSFKGKLTESESQEKIKLSKELSDIMKV